MLTVRVFVVLVELAANALAQSSCCQLESSFVIGGQGLRTRLPPLTVCSLLR